MYISLDEEGGFDLLGLKLKELNLNMQGHGEQAPRLWRQTLNEVGWSEWTEILPKHPPDPAYGDGSCWGVDFDNLIKGLSHGTWRFTLAFHGESMEGKETPLFVNRAIYGYHDKTPEGLDLLTVRLEETGRIRELRLKRVSIEPDGDIGVGRDGEEMW
jgi:hypothetical protein